MTTVDTTTIGDCIEWEGYRLPSGYGYAWSPTLRRNTTAHRRVFGEVYGYLPEVVMHVCDNPPCVNPAHLRGGTHADNRRDCMEKGRTARALDNGSGKLSDAQVRAIRRRYVGAWGQQSQLAAEFGVHPSLISRIVRGVERRYAGA